MTAQISPVMQGTSSGAPTRLRPALQLWQVVMIGLAYITPMTVFDTFGMVSEISHGHVPTAYLLALVSMLLTAFSYVQLIREFPGSGSAYTYTQKAINPYIGFMVGWGSLLCYILLPMHCAMLTKFYMSALFPAAAQWIWVFMFAAIITLINLRSISLAANFSTLFVVIQLAVIIVFVILAIRGLNNGAGKGTLFSLSPFLFEQGLLLPIISGATILCFSFIGFDSVSTLYEETFNPSKTIPKALYTVVIGGGLVFISVAFVTQLFFPDVSLFANPQVALPDIALYLGGILFQSIFLLCTLVNTLAGGLASQASVSRLLYVMGRDHSLPGKFFSYLHPRWRTPALNILFVGALVILAIFFDDHSADIAYTLVNFGALVAFTFVNLAVIAHFFIKQKRHHTLKQYLYYLVLPLCGAITIGMLWINLQHKAWVLGLTWLALGFVYLVYLTQRFRHPPPQFDESKS